MKTDLPLGKYCFESSVRVKCGLVGSQVLVKNRQQLATVISYTDEGGILIQYFNSTEVDMVKPSNIEAHSKPLEALINTPVVTDYI